jgi:hypothetical protein
MKSITSIQTHSRAPFLSYACDTVDMGTCMVTLALLRPAPYVSRGAARLSVAQHLKFC